MMIRGLFIAAVLALACSASNAAPLSLDFAGSTLQRLRAGNAGSDRFTEYGRKSDGVAETLTVRVVSDTAPFEAQVGKLVKSIKADNPNTKVHILQRPNAKDVIVSYLSDRANSNVSLMLWRMSATDAKVVAAIYRMDFDIEDADAGERVVKHVGRSLPMIPGKFSSWCPQRTKAAPPIVNHPGVMLRLRDELPRVHRELFPRRFA